MRYRGGVVEGLPTLVTASPARWPGRALGRGLGSRLWARLRIVVDHAISTVIVARWPGGLLRVASVPPSDDQERAALARAAQNLRADAGYTWVLAVGVLAELSTWDLFGPHGQAVAAVLDRARLLDAMAARDLAAARHPQADQAYSRAWRRWLEQQPGRTPDQAEDCSRVLAVHGAGPAGSPIGHGISLAWACVADSARQCAGPGAFAVNEEEDEVLLDPWATAACALLDAAMALGGPELTGPADAALLTTAWRATAT